MEKPETKKRRPRRADRWDPNSPAARVVGKFGGMRALSDQTGIPATTIFGWLRRRRIPAPQVPVLLAWAQRLKVKLKPADFMPEPALLPEPDEE